MIKKCTYFILVAVLSHGANASSDEKNTQTSKEKSPCCHPRAQNNEVDKKSNATESPFERFFTIGASARFRYEVRDDRDYNSAVNDQSEFMGNRIRLDVSVHATEYLTAFIQPQFSRVWGQTSSTTNQAGTVTTGALTSGVLSDPTFGMHQAYAYWKICNKAALKIGRQELAYGDHVVLGDVGWNNVGRSWDAGKFIIDLGSKHKLDFFYATQAEKDTSSGIIVGNADIAGAYASLRYDKFFQEVDLYSIWLRDHRAGSPSTFHFGTFGLRLKYKKNMIDGRLEAAVQLGKAAGSTMVAWMVDYEEGITFDVLQGLRFAFGYNHASGDDATNGRYTRYHAMFSTAHKWMGLMDHLGRQNIQSGIAKVKLAVNKQWNTGLAFHSFWRVQRSDLIYNLVNNSVVAGQGATPGTRDKHIGEELDLVVNFSPKEFIQFQALGGIFLPGNYITKNISNDWSYFAYLQSTFIF
ncbi:MAG: alginate export family protein [Bdellovibrionales bacterium]|nr:alginate export family protein [Bdellovibrionales bacterium]